MNKHSRLLSLSGVLLFALILSLACPTVAYADDGTPPPATEELVEPVSGGNVVPPTDEPVPHPAEGNIEVPIVENETEVPAEEVTVGDILVAAPEGIEVVVLNADGNPEPLATQAAGEITATVDPIWCPGAAQPGDPGCTDSYGTVTELIANLGTKSGAGIIYFTATYSTPDAVFDHTNVNLDELTDLTIQGGWDAASGAVSGVTTFSVPLTVSNWVGNVTINDITIMGTNATGLTVRTQGDIDLDNVVANQNVNYGADLNNTGGSGDIRVNASSFTANWDTGLEINSAGSVTLNGVTANDNEYRGAAIAAGGNINVLNSTFGHDEGAQNVYRGNDVGLWIVSTFNSVSNGSTITLSNVTADDNRNSGAQLYQWGDGDVFITGSTFDRNIGNGTSAGLYILAYSDVSLSGVSASSNGTVPEGWQGEGAHGSNGAHILNFQSLTIQDSHFDNNYSDSTNGDYGYGWGLWAEGGSGDVTLTNVTASVNGNPSFSAGGAFINTTQNISIDPSAFNNNTNGPGLQLQAYGDIKLIDVTAANNGEAGAKLYSDGDATIICSQFKDNGAFGVDAYSVYGALTMEDVTFGKNGAGTYDYMGSPVFTSGNCVVVVKEEKKEDEQGQKCIGGEVGPLLPSGDKVVLPCLFAGNLSQLTEEQLPAPIEPPYTFLRGMFIQVMDVNGAVTSLVNPAMAVNFFLTEDALGANLSILHWSEASSEWVVLEGAEITTTGFFQGRPNATGIFVLVKRE